MEKKKNGGKGECRGQVNVRQRSGSCYQYKSVYYFAPTPSIVLLLCRTLTAIFSISTDPVSYNVLLLRGVLLRLSLIAIVHQVRLIRFLVVQRRKVLSVDHHRQGHSQDASHKNVHEVVSVVHGSA